MVGSEKELSPMTSLLSDDAHAAFDPLWQSGAMKRKAAYAWLAEQLGVERVHIGQCDVDTCRRVVEICRASGEGEGK